MDVSSNNQLVPYNQGPQHITPYSPREPGSVPAVRYSAAKRYALMPPPNSPGYKIEAGDQEINQVGLLIDIYA